MKITIIQTITKTLTQDRILLTSAQRESFLLEPADGKILKSKTTGQTYPSGICLAYEAEIADFEEIDIPKTSD